MLLKCRNYKQEARMIKVRNELYFIMKPFVEKWIKSILKKWNRWEKEETILALSWDSFHFCFYKYNNFDVPIPKFFYDFTRYHLLIHYAKKSEVRISIDELKEVLELMPDEGNIGFEKYLTLLQFREVIPDKYKVVWDDATMSLAARDCDKHKSKDCDLQKREYYIIKNIFLPIIKFILND